MNNIDFEKDRVDSITQIDQTKNLSDKVIAASVCVTDCTLSSS